MAISVLHVCESDISGGAARAAYRIHRALVDQEKGLNLKSRMRVIYKRSDDCTVHGGPATKVNPLWRRMQARLRRSAFKNYSTDNNVYHSIAWPSTGLADEILNSRDPSHPTIIHLHWLGNTTLSVEEISRLPRPVVWTLHDQWAFCGAEHYTRLPRSNESESADCRFIQGYTINSRPSQEGGPDLNRQTWLRKKHSWTRPFQIICPSNWLAECAQRSALMHDWPISVIPYPIDLDQWAPLDRSTARHILNLPADRPLVLFGALGGTSDLRKGADLLLGALQVLRACPPDDPLSNLELLIVGTAEKTHLEQYGFPIHFAGILHDDVSLRLWYAASDVFVIPSRIDNFPNTGLEAHACGIPVVAFRTSGLTDIVEHHVTGALASPFDIYSLADCIRWVLLDPGRNKELGLAARKRAESEWRPQRIAKLMASLYQQSLADQSLNRS